MGKKRLIAGIATALGVTIGIGELSPSYDSPIRLLNEGDNSRLYMRRITLLTNEEKCIARGRFEDLEKELRNYAKVSGNENRIRPTFNDDGSLAGYEINE